MLHTCVCEGGEERGGGGKGGLAVVIYGIGKVTWDILLCVCVLLPQSLPCTLESCLASYTLLLDVLSAAGRPVGGVIDHGVRVFEKMRTERPNDRALADHALSILDYRCVCVCVSVCITGVCVCVWCVCVCV